jgi:hypothetical protein
MLKYFVFILLAFVAVANASLVSPDEFPIRYDCYEYDLGGTAPLSRVDCGVESGQLELFPDGLLVDAEAVDLSDARNMCIEVTETPVAKYGANTTISKMNPPKNIGASG